MTSSSSFVPLTDNETVLSFVALATATTKELYLIVDAAVGRLRRESTWLLPDERSLIHGRIRSLLTQAECVDLAFVELFEKINGPKGLTSENYQDVVAVLSSLKHRFERLNWSDQSQGVQLLLDRIASLNDKTQLGDRPTIPIVAVPQSDVG